MNSFAPWRIARNFVRAFFPTLILLLSWDLWRRLKHVAPATRLALMTDAIALGIVLFIRLTSPLKQTRKQLKYFFRLSDNSFVAASIIFPFVISFKPTSANRQDALLLLVVCALFADIVRVCKIRIGISFGSVCLIGGSLGLFAYEISTLISWLGQEREDVAKWSNTLTCAANILVLFILRAFANWWKEQQSFPTVQRLDLNSEEHPIGKTPSPTSTASFT